MAYTPFDPSKPVTTPSSRQVNIDAIRTNGMALRDALLTGDMKGWNYSKSGGTADQPAITYRRYGATTEWVRATLTWGTTGGEAGNVTNAVYAYSANSTNGTDGSWDTIGTLAIAFDSEGYITSTTWS